jgi:hypothetical protein
MPLLELAQAQTQKLDFANDSEREVQFETQLENEDTLSPIIYNDEKGRETQAWLRLNSGEPEQITLEQANGLISARARQQQAADAEYWRSVVDPPGEGAVREPGWSAQDWKEYDEAEPATAREIREKLARRQLDRPLGLDVSAQGATVERVILPVEKRLSPELLHAGYVPVERVQHEADSYFKLDAIRHDIVQGAADYDRTDPVITAAATNYYAGQRDLYNNIRAGLILQDPRLEAVLPWEIRPEEIQAPEIEEERDKEHEQPTMNLVSH